MNRTLPLESQATTLALQSAMAVLHAFTCAYLALASAGAVWAGYGSLAPSTRLWLWLGAASGLVWTLVNVRALWQRKSWAARSSLAYWLLPCAFWCCIPIPLWGGLRMLRRRP